MSNYIYKKIISIIVLIGAINWGLEAINLNFFRYITNNKISKEYNIENILYIIVGLSGLFAMKFFFTRDNMLPFLGDTVYPCTPLKEKTPLNHNKSVTINVVPNSNVIYWAAESVLKENKNNKQDPWKIAYNNYENSGVVKSDKNGNAILKFRNPSAYTVPYKGLLKPHVHYRVCGNNGMLSRVETVDVI